MGPSHRPPVHATIDGAVHGEPYPLTGGLVVSDSKQEKEAHGEIETEHPGYLGGQDTYYICAIKGVDQIYQQTSIDTYSRVDTAKLSTYKRAITAADLLNDRVVPL